MTRRKAGVAIILAASLLFAGPVGNAGEIEQVQFAQRIDLGDFTLKLQGLGLMRYRLVIKAFVGGLYLGEGVSTSKVLDNVPKRIEIHYFWSIAGKDFSVAADTVLADNFDQDTLSAHQAKIKKMNSYYKDVKPGDRYAITYIPGKGTSLELNGKELGLVEGEDFAGIYFAIWLGKKPMSDSFKNQIMGRN